MSVPIEVPRGSPILKKYPKTCSKGLSVLPTRWELLISKGAIRLIDKIDITHTHWINAAI